MKKRITAFTITLSIIMSLISIPTAVQARFKEISEDEYAAMPQTFKQLDLTAIANRGFADDVSGDGKGGWTDQGAENDLSRFELRGLCNLKGVDFNIIDPDKNDGKSCVVLRGQNDKNVPTSAEMIVDDVIAGVYFLHASAYVQKEVGKYVFVYEDGTKEEVVVRGSNDVFNWWGSGQGDYTVTAWTGSNAMTSAVSLYMFCCENPRPTKKVSKIVAETSGTGSYLMLVAATATSAGPYKPVPADQNPDTTTWYAYEQPGYGSTIGTALDASYLLDAPAGKHGYINKNGEKLYFEDGTEVQFWAINVSGDSIFDTSKPALERLAARIAALGFNCVRLHHLDAFFNAPTNIFGGGGYAGHRKEVKLDPWRMDKLCYFMNALKERGIYWMLDQTVSRYEMEEDNFDPDYKNDMGVKRVAYFDAQAQENRMRYSEMLLTWKNQYTEMTVGEDPSLVLIDLENENQPSWMFSFAAKYDYYKKELSALLLDWLRREYGTDEAVIKAWTDNTGKKALMDGESIEKGYIEIAASTKDYTDARRDDLIRFAFDLVIDYGNRYTERLRNIGVKALIVPMTNFGSHAPTNAYAHAVAGDFTDIHAYWGGMSGSSFGTGSSGGDVCSAMDKNFRYFGGLANSRVYGMPYIISEWNISTTGAFASEANMLMASYSLMQNWNPFCFAMHTDKFQIDFDYPDEIKKVESGLVYEDKNIMLNDLAVDCNPVKMGTLPAASMLFHRRDVKEADRGYYDRYGDNDYYDADAYLFPTDAGYAMIGKTGAMYDVKEYDESKLDNDVLYLSKKAKKDETPFVSVTGEMSTDIKNQIFRVNTARSQSSIGHTSGTVQELDDVKFEMDNNFSSCTLTSLSKDEPIYSCDKLLLTAAGDHRNSGEVRSNDTKRILKAGHAPILVEQITGKVTLKSKDNFEVYTLSSSGKRVDRAMTRKDQDGNTVIYLQLDDHCMNYEIVRTKKNGESKPNEKIVFPQNKIEPVFTDVGFDHWANKEITRLALLEKIDLDWGGEFNPEENLTKGTALKWIAVSSDLTNKKSTSNFANIVENDPDKKIMALVKTYELAKGDENDNIDKGAPITRAELMTAMEKAINATGQNKSGITGTEKASYSDWNEVPEEMKDSVEFMLAQRYVKDLWQGRIEPQKPVTRAELAHILFGMLMQANILRE